MIEWIVINLLIRVDQKPCKNSLEGTHPKVEAYQYNYLK